MKLAMAAKMEVEGGSVMVVEWVRGREADEGKKGSGEREGSRRRRGLEMEGERKGLMGEVKG